MKERGHIIGEDEFELEKNIYKTNLTLECDNVEVVAERQAKEIAINKQSFSVASDLLSASMMRNEDAMKLLSEVLDTNKLTCVYLGNSLKEEILRDTINN